MKKILLSRAFLRVLWAIEAANQVPEQQRLGLPAQEDGTLNDERFASPLSEDDMIPPAPAHGALGESFLRLMQHRQSDRQATFARQPRRRGAPTSQPDPIVVTGATTPRLPDRQQLLALMNDHTSGGGASMSEQRVCRAHEKLINNLQDGKIGAWAVELHYQTEEDLEAGRSLDAGSGPIPQELWSLCDVDYLNDATQGIDRRQFDDGHKPYWRYWALSEIFVDYDQLNELVTLDHDMSPAAEGAPVIGLREEDDNWFVSVNGREHALGAGHMQQSRQRGLRAIKLLLRYPGRRVSFYILAGLARKPTHTNQRNPEEIEKLDALQTATELVALDLYLHPENSNLDQAQRELGVKIGKIEFPDDAALGLKWWESTLGDGRENATRARSYKAVSQKVRVSIGDALELIQRGLPWGSCTIDNDRRVIAKQLDRRIKRGSSFAIFE